jgi:two-component system, chemotaxis family, response regulator Rcp1
MTTNPTLLVVDDNPADVALTREALARSPIQITACLDGEEALALLQKEGKHANTKAPDLMILDLSLPKKDGFAVLATVKSEPKLKCLPVIVFSSSTLPVDIARSYELGASCYVSKPGNLKDYFSAIEAIQGLWFDIGSVPPKGE